MKKLLISLIFICLFIAVGFFGLGPVLFADGSMQERLGTLAIVILIYVVLTYILVRLLRNKDRK